MAQMAIKIGYDCQILKDNVLSENPDDKWFQDFLSDYYIVTKDYQYLFGSTQPGRRPDCVYYMVPEDYRLGKEQKKFDTTIGKKLFEVVLRYLQEENIPVIIQDGIQGEHGYEIGLRVTISVKNPHSAYIGWFGKLMIFPRKENHNIECWNFIVQESLPISYINEIRKFWPGFDPDEPLTLFDFTEIDQNRRRVLNLRIDYFGGAYKKPNLTMVWNKAESDGFISYHAGMTSDRVLKGLSGTGKTTLTVGPDLEQDDACVGKILRNAETNRIEKVQLIGLEAASFAKSQDLDSSCPEWPGLMKSREIDEYGNHPIVLALNIDCENVKYQLKDIKGYMVKLPVVEQGKQPGSLLCKQYTSSGTTNGRFVFSFSELNPNWGKNTHPRYLRTVVLVMKRFDCLEPLIRVVDPNIAVALDSCVESVITSAISNKKSGTRVRSYAATDFLVREQCQQALLKLEMYRDLGLDLDGKLTFIVLNTGAVGMYDIDGNTRCQENELESENDAQTILERWIKFTPGKKITVQQTKILLTLSENRQIERWISHPIFGDQILVPDPNEISEYCGMGNYCKSCNYLRYYDLNEYLQLIKRDLNERSEFLNYIFEGQEFEQELNEIIHIWDKYLFPDPHYVLQFYQKYDKDFPFSNAESLRI